MKPPSSDALQSVTTAILEVSLDAIVSMDHDGLVTEFNPAAERTFGYTRAQALGKPLVELLIPPPLREAHRTGLQRYLTTGEGPVIGKRIELTGMRSDGSEFPAEVAICRIPSSDPPAFTGFIRDLTESKRAAQALSLAEERNRLDADRRLASMLEATPDFVGIADAHSAEVLYVNRAGLRMCGLPVDADVRKLHLSDFHPAWVCARVLEEALPAAAREGVWSGELPFLHRDGHEIPTLMIIMAHRGADGRVECFSTISRDITDRKRAEEIERSLVHEQAARAAAEEAVRVRDDFVATAGHELKTPLTSLLLHVRSMQRAVRTGRPVDFADHLDKLARSGVRLEKLVNQLLDVSRITAGQLRLEPEPMDLADLVREVVTRFAEEGARVGCAFSLRGDDHVRGVWDRLRIDLVLTNLVSNAIKYGQGKPVEVEVAAECGTAVVRVTDHGIGIDPQRRERLFSRFERAVSSRQYGGFGLGLWIARQIVEASGGTISVESEPGRGSTFTFHLPACAEEGVTLSTPT
jgi:PAS domain S-box-containing protein